jgi:hypothetical protein
MKQPENPTKSLTLGMQRIPHFIYIISCFRLRTTDVASMDENARNWLRSNSLTEKRDDTFLYPDDILHNYTTVIVISSVMNTYYKEF